jgi:FKBP-type peptidyl-prolyl cis-trans isomerase FkpA
MRFVTFFCVGLGAVVLSGCKENTKETPLGYKFSIVSPGDGKIVKPGDILIVDMAIADANDSLWYDNRATDYPEMIRISDVSKMETERGISEVFRMLSKGDSVLFPMRAKDVFLLMWRMDVPDFVDPDSYFTYQLKVRDVIDESQMESFMHVRDSVHAEHEKARVAKEQEAAKQAALELIEYNKQQIAKDTVIIDNYLKSKNVKAMKLPSGLRYIIKTPGQGAMAESGDVVSIRYDGQFLDGNQLDQGEFTFKIDDHDVISGWEEIAKHMRIGTSMTVFIPSPLGYGKAGKSPRVGPDAILVFDMELVEIR